MSQATRLPSRELREPRLRERLAVLLARDIAAGRLPVGEAFPSAEELVVGYGVSRTVARETVQTLSMLGLVRVQHGKRTEVLPEEEWDVLSSVVQEALRSENRAGAVVRDLYDLRLLVEPQGAAWTAERATDEQVAQLQGLARTMREYAAAGDSALVLDTDREFHNLIARASGNRLLAAVGRDIREVQATLWELSRAAGTAVERAAEHHERLAEAIARRDPAAAATAMREHLAWAADEDMRSIEGAT